MIKISKHMKSFPCYAPFWRIELPHTCDMCDCKKECIWENNNNNIPEQLQKEWIMFIKDYIK